jgi:glycerophosphoryl diester phosphodiesterase
VELDVRRTKDHHLVIYHCPLLPACGERPAMVICDTFLADLPSFVPTLKEALGACEGWVNVEIKNHHYETGFDELDSIADQVCDELLEHSPHEMDRYILSSFRYSTVLRVREYMPNLRTAFLTDGYELFRGGENNEQHVDTDHTHRPPVDQDGQRALDLDAIAEVVMRIQAAGIHALHVKEDAMTSQLVAACHAADRQCSAWVVNTAERGMDLIAMGADGLCTNLPDEASKWIAADACARGAVRNHAKTAVRARAKTAAPYMEPSAGVVLMPAAVPLQRSRSSDFLKAISMDNLSILGDSHR